MGQLQNMVHGNKSKLKHADLQQTGIKKDEDAVSAVVNLTEGWVNPFAVKQDLMSISTAKSAPRDVTSELTEAYDIDEKCNAIFKEERQGTKIHQRRHFMIP